MTGGSAVKPVSSGAVLWPGVQFSSQNSLAGSFLVFCKHYWYVVENVLLWLPTEPFLLFTDLIAGRHCVILSTVYASGVFMN